MGPAPPQPRPELIGAGMAACPGLPAFEPLPGADKPDWLQAGSAPALPGPRQEAAAPAPFCSAGQHPAPCPLWTVAGQYCVGAGEEEKDEEEKATGCSRCCPSWVVSR